MPSTVGDGLGGATPGEGGGARDTSPHGQRKGACLALVRKTRRDSRYSSPASVLSPRLREFFSSRDRPAA